MPAPSVKGPEAFRTIGEVASELGVGQHILRYWEGKFPQLRPLQRAGNRRYYRPEDVALVRRIHQLLNRDGYTVRGVQALLREKPGAALVSPAVPIPPELPLANARDLLPALKRLRMQLAETLD